MDPEGSIGVSIALAVAYYCEAARAYYPYVASCPGSWKSVPAAPPGQ